MNTPHSYFRLVLTASLLLTLALPGCLPPPPRPLQGSGMDMFAPISMRLHPLTRIITPPLPATPEIEARLECTDQMGDITKGVGSVSFQLCSWEFASLSHQGPRLATWISDITTPDHNKLHWDPITRTYLFHLPLEASIPLSPGKKYVLLATLHFTNNTQLTDDIVLTIK